jgi:N utilization substance protein A
MATTADIPRLEMLQVADMVAREKGIEREEVLEAMEEAIQKAARSRYGLEHDIRAEINPADAKKMDSDAEIGNEFREELPPFDFGRVAAQTAKQVITQQGARGRARRQYEEFKDRVGEIINGTVKRVEYGNIIVDLGRGEGIMRRNETIPRESFNIGDRVRCYIYDVRARPRARRSSCRAPPQFMAKLFAQEVPEVYDGVIEIKAVARDPGSRAKIACLSERQLDRPGRRLRRHARQRAFRRSSAELQGEKIDIIPWNDDEPPSSSTRWQPAEVSKVVIDEDAGRVEVVVPDEQLSLAIGRRGQNVRSPRS